VDLIQHDNDLWSAEYQLDLQRGLLPIPVRMTVIRLGDGQLILHSPGPLTPDVRTQLDALGHVGFIVVPKMHGRFAAKAAQDYPRARLLAAPSTPSRQHAIVFHASLASEPPAAWAGEVESHLMLGFRLEEVVLFHRPSRSLVITDLCFNIHRSPSRLARRLFQANGMWQSFGPSRLIRWLGVSDRAAFRRSFEHILQWDFERIIPGHGDVIEHGGPAALRPTWLR